MWCYVIFYFYYVYGTDASSVGKAVVAGAGVSATATVTATRPARPECDGDHGRVVFNTWPASSFFAAVTAATIVSRRHTVTLDSRVCFVWSHVRPSIRPPVVVRRQRNRCRLLLRPADFLLTFYAPIWFSIYWHRLFLNNIIVFHCRHSHAFGLLCW